jgi:predicted dehydrogenase
MDRLSWGLIGCGDIARKRVAPALRDLKESDLVAVSRRRGHLAESFAQEFGARRWYSNWQDLLLDDEIDAIYIATPVHLHAAQTIAAAQAGKHVLCEKPLALNVRECDQMLAACRDNKVKFGVAYYRHFYPLIRRIKEVIASGEIGMPVMGQINAFEWFNPTSDDPRAWLLNKRLSGGGPMFDFGCHRLEVFTNIFGAATNVKAICAKVLFAREVEDTATALLQFEQGTCGVLTVSHAVAERQDTLDIFGSHGSIRVTALNEAAVRIVNRRGERIETHPPAENLHAPLIEDFMAAVREDRDPAVSGQVGRSIALIEEQIYNPPILEQKV